MRVTNSQIVPVAFWVGFLALGFATSFEGRSHEASVKLARPAAAKIHHDADATPDPREAAIEDMATKTD